LYRTENLRAIIAAEFLRSGNWIVPSLYGEPLFTKPPGAYAAIALVSWPFGGVSEWTARLPSALAATALVLLFFWYFSRQLGRVAGLVAAVILPLSVMWLDKVPSAEIDALQVAWVGAAILFFLRALEDEEDRGSPWGWWLAALLCVAGGVLTKWTAPAFFYGTVIPLLWRRGRLRLLLGWRHLASAALAAGICLGWAALAVAQTDWRTFFDTVSREALQRLSPGHYRQARLAMAPHHHAGAYPWLEALAHPVVIVVGSLPWSAFALVTLWPGFGKLWDERGRRLLQAMHCWTWPNLLIWSIIPEHAARHSFPLCPGIAGLAALGWVAMLTGKWSWRAGSVSDRSSGASPVAHAPGSPARVFVGLVLCWVLVKLAFVNCMVPLRNPNRAPRDKGEQIAAVVPPEQPLYLFRLKDEGILFYYGRLRPKVTGGPPARRLAGPEHLPSHAEPVYCILDDNEWRQWHGPRRIEALLPLTDEQGAPIVLARVLPSQRGARSAERGTEKAPSSEFRVPSLNHSPLTQDTDR
jgi:4-amino-4-deoxy-L-arabinose transferase-like glycosyltransferase